MSNPDPLIESARRNRERYLDELKAFIAIPSISTLPQHKADIQRAAEWIAGELRTMGMNDVAVMPTAGHPVVYADWLGAPGKPTVLIYGHYDVQPVDPLGEWRSPPFEATQRGDNLYARGAADMKGQVHSVLKALEAWLRNGGLPVNVKVMFEGEEELGSPNLAPFIEQNKDKLRGDLLLNADSGIERPDLPSLVYGLRGMAYFELWVYGPAQDLHSGMFGGSVHNPAQVLCELVAGMHDANGRITLPRFYDKVRELSRAERAELAGMPFDDEGWRKQAGVPALYGEAEYTTPERLGTRPTLEVNGISGGFTSEGLKTIVPAKAMAKVSTRLVPFQDPDDVERALNEYVRAHAPPTVRWEVKKLTRGGPAVLVERDTPGMRAAVRAIQETYGKPPVFQLIGGSVPVVSMARDLLGLGAIMLGFSVMEGANLHSPNEQMHLPTYYRGIEAYIRFFDALAEG